MKVIVFDLDDTLYLEKDYVESGFAAVDSYLNRKFGLGGFFEVAWKRFQQGKRGKIFDDSLLELEAGPIPGGIPRLVEIYRNHTPQIALPEDSRRILENLGKREIGLGLITDGYLVSQEQKIAALGLKTWIPARICTDYFGRESWKPHPTGFLKIQEFYGISGSECLYIGDNPTKDFIGARNLGWSTVRLKRPGGEHFYREAEVGHEADWTIHQIEETMAIWEKF